jgi:hypothetical protein
VEINLCRSGTALITNKKNNYLPAFGPSVENLHGYTYKCINGMKDYGRNFKTLLKGSNPAKMHLPTTSQ